MLNAQGLSLEAMRALYKSPDRKYRSFVFAVMIFLIGTTFLYLASPFVCFFGDIVILNVGKLIASNLFRVFKMLTIHGRCVK